MAECKSKRLFIALSVSKDTIRHLRDLQCHLKQRGIRASWTPEKNMHLTLKFLGDTCSGVEEKLMHHLQHAAAAFSPFMIFAGGLGVFPSVKKPRVLWSKVKGETENLRNLYSSIETELSLLGFQKDGKRFHPHFTIGRTKGRVSPHTIYEMIDRLSSFQSKPFQVTGVHLFKSDLEYGSAVHTRLFSAEFSSCF